MRIRISTLWGYIYITISLFMFAFINFNDATVFLPITVPHIEGKVVLIHFFFLLVGCTFFVLSLIKGRKLILDGIAICLFIKCILDLIPFTYSMDIREDIAYYAITVSSFLTYIFISNASFSQADIHQCKKCIMLFGLILSLQVFYTALFCGIPYLEIEYKSAMVIPYGGSNIIAAILLPIFCLLVKEKSAFKVKPVIVSILSLAIILTKSRGGILLLLACALYLYAAAYNKKKSLKNVLLMGAFLLIAFAFIFSNSNEIYTVFLGYSTVSKNTGINALVSGRFSSWGKVLTAGTGVSLFFGSGMKPVVGNLSGAHNIVIDLIGRCGVLGLANYTVLFILLIRKGKKLSSFGEGINALFLMVIIIYINALFEVCYFTYSCDTLLWIFVGLLSSEYNAKKQECKRLNAYGGLSRCPNI